MFQRLKKKLKVKNEFFLLFLVLLITIVSTGYHNYSKKKLLITIKKLLKIFISKKPLIIFLVNSNQDLKRYHIKWN